MPLDLETLAAFAATTMLICLVPGPDMMFIVATAVRTGPRAGVAAAMGMAAGMATHTVAATLGLSAILASSATAFSILRWAGVLYLSVLAIRAIRDSTEKIPVVASEDSASEVRVFRQATITNLLNPKIVLFYLAFLPQFTDPARGSLSVQLLVLGLIFLTIGLVVDTLVGLASGGLGQSFARSVRVRQLLNRLSAAVYAGLAARLVIDR